MRLLWIDVSSYEDNVASGRLIDFNKAKAAGAVAVSFRCNQGTAEDASFSALWKACKGILPRQAYTLLDCRYDWKPQVQMLLDLTAPDPGELPDCFDFEEPFAMPDAQYWKYQFSGWNPLYDAISYHQTARPGMKPWVYTTAGFWNLAAGNIPSASAQWFAQFPLWVAEYPENGEPIPSDQEVPNPIPSAWAPNWLAWQFTPSGNAQDFGISPLDAHSVDESVFNLTMDQFNAMIGKPVIVVVTPPSPVTPAAPTLLHTYGLYSDYTFKELS